VLGLLACLASGAVAVLQALTAKLAPVGFQTSVEHVAEHRNLAALVAAARPLATLGSGGDIGFSRIHGANLPVVGAAVTVLSARQLALETAGNTWPAASGLTVLASGTLAREADRLAVTAVVVGCALFALARLVRARLAPGRARISAVVVAAALPATVAVHALAAHARVFVESVNAHARLALVVGRAAGGFARQAVTCWLGRRCAIRVDHAFNAHRSI